MKKILSLLIVFTALSFTNGQDGEGLTGKSAPGFKLEDINGKLVSLSSLTGKAPVIVSFWATWCKPCAEEMVEYKKIAKDYEEKGVKIVAISTDNEKSVAKVKPYIKSKGYNDFVVLLDTNNEAARKYYVSSVPFSVIINKDGKIVYAHTGFMRGDELKVREKLDELLK
ncbi:MAG: TlpA family protein disulfide reductase [Ignavibacteriaceae bacterium]|nr:TlpA family protein disulfide reductase [Ignavibacteriaceae bacterium]